jgi:hypothetical protein
MFTLADINVEVLYALLKGEPGTRKSTQALSFPKPQYWFSWDQKMEALLLPMRHWGINPRDISADDYSDWNKPVAKLQQLQLNCPYKTLVFDSITSCADAINRQTMKTKSAKGEGKVVGGISVNSIEDFNAEDSALRDLIAVTKDIHLFHKVNIVIIAHVTQKERKSDDGKTHMSRVIMTAGKGIAQKLPAYCGEVYHFNIKTDIDISKGGQYALKTTHTGDDFARTALPLDPEIVFGTEPLYERWLKPAIEKMKQSQQPQTPPPPTPFKI